MSAPESRRAFITIGLTGLAGLMVGCPSRSSAKRSGSSDSAGTATDSASPKSDSGTNPKDTAAGTDTSTSLDTSATVCAETPDNIEGPFWVPGVPIRTEYDLYGDRGTSLTISGQVTDLNCVPIPGAIVEIWQANPEGVYDNTSPEKRYRGQMAADESGRYSFHTLRPGLYLNGPRYRPSHIHIKIWVGGAHKKTTQLYFEGDPYIEGDEFVVDGLILPLSGSEAAGFTGTYDFAVDT